MKFPLIAATAAALALTAPASRATVINSAYTPLGGDAWLASFTVTNDGHPAGFAGFSVDIPNATNLVLRASPSTWDSMVFQPDPALSDDGFLDSFVIDPANALAAGESIGGFEVSFAFTAGAVPGALPFMIYDASFALLSSGTTTVAAVAKVPEPPAVLLAALGLAFLGFGTARKQAARRDTTEQVAA